MIEFVYEETIRKKLDEGELIILCDNPLEEIKGLAFDNETIVLNLSAKQWKDLPETFLIDELGKTISHEFIHLLIRQEIPYKEFEEKIVRILSGQEGF